MKLFPAIPMILAVALGLPAQEHQHPMEMMHHGAAAKLEVANDQEAHVLTMRWGPLNLPAHGGPMQMDTMEEPAPALLTVPFDGWITGYHPRLVNDDGARLPNRLLHHVAFWNTARSDFLCPNHEEHIFGAGGEMNEWPKVPGFGYRVHAGDQIRITGMFHNPTAEDYPRAFLEVKIDYQAAGEGQGLHSVYPAWFDVEQCGRSDYDLAPGKNVTSGSVTVRYSGVLIGVGGHMHDYAQQLVLEDVTTHDTVADLHAQLDAQGHILSMPIVMFADRGGYRLNRNDVLKATATYENPTGRRLVDGAMGIVVGYFLPDQDAQMNELARKKK